MKKRYVVVMHVPNQSFEMVPKIKSWHWTERGARRKTKKFCIFPLTVMKLERN